MKLTSSSNHKDQHARGRLRALERARAQLSHAASYVLSGGLEALGERLQGGPKRPSTALLAQMGAAAQAHAHRLREVVERDRALAASAPDEEPSESHHSHGTPGETERPASELADDALQALDVIDGPDGLHVLSAPFDAAREVEASNDRDLTAAPASAGEEPPPAITQALANVPFVASAARVAPAAPVSCKEPIRTRTMAKLLAKQGHRQRALSIYDFLIAEDQHDAGLRAEADALRASE